MQKIVPCLWFEDQAEEAVKFYSKVFKRSKTGRVLRNPEGGRMKPGTVLTIQFWLDGQEFLALNGGPDFKFSEAVSFVVYVKDQEELDRMWEKLSKGGERVACGWLKDRFGLSWQVTPIGLPRMLAHKKRGSRVMQAVLSMKKLDIEALEKAYAGK